MWITSDSNHFDSILVRSYVSVRNVPAADYKVLTPALHHNFNNIYRYFHRYPYPSIQIYVLNVHCRVPGRLPSPSHIYNTILTVIALNVMLAV